MADEIARLARESWPEECCGIILAEASEPSLGVRLLHCRNVERRDPRRRYRLDHRVHIRAIEEELRCGARIVGYYHSHPAGSAQPSALDAESGVPGVTYVVAGLAEPPELRAWRCTGGGFQEEPIFVEERSYEQGNASGEAQV